MLFPALGDPLGGSTEEAPSFPLGKGPYNIPWSCLLARNIYHCPQAKPTSQKDFHGADVKSNPTSPTPKDTLTSNPFRKDRGKSQPQDTSARGPCGGHRWEPGSPEQAGALGFQDG